MIVHKDEEGTPLYVYDRTIYTKAAEKCIIVCKIHGEFLQTPNAHLGGHGCVHCGKTQCLTRAEFIKKCEEKHPDKLDYSKTMYMNRTTPAIFICKECKNEFTRSPNKMLSEGRGHGCSNCNGGTKDDLESFLKKALLKHGDIFDYRLVEYVSSQIKVKIICRDGHIFEQTPAHHLGGDGCRKCGGYYRTTADVEALSRAKFKDKFNFSKAIFTKMHEPLILICPLNHEFSITPTVHLRDDSDGGCHECAKISIAARNCYGQEEWIALATKKHDGFYTYEKVEYVSSQEYVTITCPTHGDFEQTPAQHLGGRGCRPCGIAKNVASKLYSEEDKAQLIALCSEIHSEKYTYIDVFTQDGRLYISMYCDTHGEFSQRLDHHRSGHGCVKCVTNYSRAQIEWLNYIAVSGTPVQHALNGGEYQVPGMCGLVDGYDPKTNTVYEFQGDFWHGNPRRFKPDDINTRNGCTFGFLFERTQAKNTRIRDLGYNVVEMWEIDWDRAIHAVTILQAAWRRKRALGDDGSALGGAGVPTATMPAPAVKAKVVRKPKATVAKPLVVDAATLAEAVATAVVITEAKPRRGRKPKAAAEAKKDE